MNRKRKRSGYRPGPPGGGTPPRTPEAAPDPEVRETPRTVAVAPLAPPVSARRCPQTPRKDQQRALIAYQWADQSKESGKLPEFEIAVQGFAAALLRSGFAAAVSVLERSKDRDGFKLLLDRLSSHPLPGIPDAASADWPARVRALPDVGLYMQATRELILLLGWLLRACRALDVEEKP